MNPTPQTMAYWKHLQECPTCHATVQKWFWTEYGLCPRGRELLVESMNTTPIPNS